MKYDDRLSPLDEGQIEELARDPRGFVAPRHREMDGAGTWPGFEPGADNGPPPTIFYKPGELLTTVEFAAEVRAVLIELGVLGQDPYDDRTAPAPGEPPFEAEARYVRRDDRPDGVATFTVTEDSLAVARSVKRLLPAAPVGPHHVLTLAPQPSIGPGSDPRPTDDGPDLGPKAQQDPAAIAVVDTGMWITPPPRPELAASVDPASSNVEIVDGDGDTIVDHRGSGHGGFITGIILSRVPNATVHNYDAFEPAGELTELGIVARVDQALRDHDIVVLNLSLGSYEDACGGTQLVALRDAIARWSHQRNRGLLVAAAGNDSVSSPWYPAGFAADHPDFVVSVGALDPWRGGKEPGPRSRVAAFSNFGSWVNAWAPGVDIVSDYPEGLRFVYFNPDGSVAGTGRFDAGRAKWSGTSFAAPFAAAEIARYAADHGLTPRDAWRKIRSGRPFVIFGT